MYKSLAEQCIALAWSQWTALGVSGHAPEPQRAIDLEAAIVFAPALAELDPRLHDEVLDWCIQFSDRFVSVSVLKNVVEWFDEGARARFDSFAATVNAHAGTRWPAHGARALKIKPSGKSTCRVDSAVAIALRARKIFGIDARADILVDLVLQAGSGWSRVSDFAALGYAKRTIAMALDDLHTGGLLERNQIGNSLRYRLRDQAPLPALLAPVPGSHFRSATAALVLAESLLSARRASTGKSATTAAVEIHKVMARRSALLAALDQEPPPLRPDAPWSSIDEWIEPLLRP